MLFDNLNPILELFKNNIRYIKIKNLLCIIILLMIKSSSNNNRFYLSNIPFDIDNINKVILFIYISE